MRKGIEPERKQRYELFRLLMEKHISPSTAVKIMTPMENKPEEEKERIAAELIFKIQAGEIA